jgi:hypothetical protein
VSGTFYADKLDWKSRGYGAAPTPANDPARAGDPNAGLWVQLEAVVTQAKGGDFAGTSQLPGLYREAIARSDWVLAYVCVKVLGDTGPGPLLRQLQQQLLDVPRGDPKKAFDFCRVLAAWGKLSAVPVLIEQYEEHAMVQDFEVLPIQLSWLLEPEWGPVCLDHPTRYAEEKVEDYCAFVTGVYRQLKQDLGTDDTFVFHGQRFGVVSLARLLQDRLGFDHYRAAFWPLFRRKFEAATGIDCSVFFKDRSFQPLTAAAMVEEFLESPEASRYQEGVRYFFGHPLPD